MMAAGKLPASPKARMQRAAMKKYMLTMAMVAARADPASTARSAAASGSPTHASVAMPQRACIQAPTDQTPMAHR